MLVTLRRSLVLLLAAISFLAVAAATAFISSSYREPALKNSEFYLTAAPYSDQQTLEAINQAAAQAGVNLYRASLTFDENIFFTFAGDPQASLADNSGVIREFNPEKNSHLRPYTEFNEYTLLGVYYSDADPQSVLTAVTYLRDNGFTADEALASESTPTLVQRLSHTVMLDGGGVLIVAWFALFAAAVYDAARRYRDCVIKTVHGQSHAVALSAENLRLVTLYASVLGVMALLGLPLLYIYNGLAQFADFAAVVGALSALGLLVALLGQLLVFLALSPRPFFTLLKGSKPVILIGSLSVILQTVAMLAFFVTLVFSSFNINILSAQLAKNDRWKEAKDFVKVVARGFVDGQENRKLAEFMKQEESAGRVLLAVGNNTVPDYIHKIPSEQVDEYIKTAGMHPREKNPVRLINNLYLKQQPLFAADGKRIENLPEEDNRVYALVFDGYPHSEEKIVNGLREWIYAHRARELHGDLLQKYWQEGKTNLEASKLVRNQMEPAQVKVIRLAAGQELFDYVLPDKNKRVSDLRPEAGLLLFAPPKTQVASYDEGFFSSGGVLFADPKGAKEYFDNSGLGQSYRLSYPAAREILDDQRERLGRLTLQMLVLLLAGVVVFLAGTVLSRIYCEVNSRRHFVETINGFSFRRMHAVFLGSIAVFSVALCGIFFPLFLARPDMLPFYGAGVLLCAAYFLFVVFALRLNQQRLRVQVLTENNG